MLNIPQNSRYKTTQVVKYNGMEMLGKWPGFSWIKSDPFYTIIVEPDQVGRLDVLAKQHLGSPDLWWAIMYFNNITDINWPRSGDVVKIPNPALILSELA